MVEDLKATLIRLAEVLMFPHEREKFSVAEKYQLPNSKSVIEDIRRGLERINKLLDDAARVRELLTERSLTARQVQTFLPISARQVAEWDKRGILSCGRETDKSNRQYSIIDLAWIEIIHKFQSHAFSKIEKTSEKLRPLLDEGLLELCLVRDYYSAFRPIAIVKEDGKARLYRQDEGFVVYNIENLVQFIPITAIMHNVQLKVGMLAGVSSLRIPISQIDNDFKRVFHFDGKEVCFGDEIRDIEHQMNLRNLLETQDKQACMTYKLIACNA